MIVSLLNALVAIPKIAALVESAVAQIVGWYIGRQQAATLSAIADAAALSARAQTDDERYKSAQAWAAALSRPRITP